MKLRFHAALLTIGLLCLANPVYANRTLVFQVHSERMEKDETKEPSDYKLTVVLGRDFFSRDNGTSRTIFDFEKKRIYTVKDSKKQYEDDSLYSDLGFRIYEMKNRQFLGGALQKAGVKDNPMTAAFSEQLFSLEMQNSNTRIDEATRNGALMFSADGKPLMTISTTGDSVAQDELGRFLRFVRYTYGGHPTVLRKIATLRKISSNITISRYDVATEIVNLVLVSNQTGPDAPYSLKGFDKTLHKFDDEKLARTILRLNKESPEKFRKQSGETLLSATKAFEQKQYLSCMLAYLEYTLQTGQQLPESFQGRRQVLQNDENVGQFLAILNPKSKEEAEKALPVYEKLRARAGAKEHVLMIFEANVRLSLGQGDKAEKLFLRVLERNPYIVGVYKDLGDIYFNKYLTNQAWQCWDLGRRLAPEFKNFKQINEFEQTLVREHAEFF